MSKENSTRSGCKDVFHAFLVKNAQFDTELEIPCIKPESSIPQKLIPFSKAVGGTDYDCFVHFYEDDANFERLWNNPQKYLPILQKYKGVITPDFSLYRDMPLVMQQWNTYRSRAVGHWLQENGIPTIANVRWGDERTYDLCCAGVPKNSIIAVGSHGCIKLLQERPYFINGLDYAVQTLRPKIILYTERHRIVSLINTESKLSKSCNLTATIWLLTERRWVPNGGGISRRIR